MKKFIAVFFSILFILFAFSSAAAAEEDPVPTTEKDPWVEIVSDVAGDQLTGHEEEVKRDLNFAEKFMEKLNAFVEMIRDAFNDLWKQISALFSSVKDSISGKD